MHTPRTYLSFWDIEMSNFPVGAFRRRVLSAAEARSIVNSARASGTLVCVAKKDLAAPYCEKQRHRHKELCTALRAHVGIDIQFEDFFGNDYANPLCFAKIEEKKSLLVVDCTYAVNDETRPDSTTTDASAYDEPPTARDKRLLERTFRRLSVDPDSIKFCVFEQTEPPASGGDLALLDAAEFTKRLEWSLDDLVKAVAAQRVFFLQATISTPLYPAFYTDQRYNRKQLEAVTKRLGDLTGGSKWQFFTNPKGSLGGVTPLVALLDGKLALVKKCADGFLER